jgi:hypothetical protein
MEKMLLGNVPYVLNILQLKGLENLQQQNSHYS